MEDEKHSLLDCTLYKDLNELRFHFFLLKEVSSFQPYDCMTGDSIFSLIMSSVDIQFLSLTATFNKEAFKLRIQSLL